LTEVTITPAERRLVLTALAVVLLLSALDQTIVSTAMPRIIEQLHGLSMYAWVTTAYMLTSTVAVPIYGKLSDLYGRKPILIIGVLLFLGGSALCGLAGEFGDLPVLGGGMTQLIVFRALQGLGGGALMTCTFAIIADLFAPRERGRLFGVFGSVFGLATIIGPFIGGFFTDHGTVTLLDHEVAGWRWVFYVNLPLGLIALFMILYRMPGLPRRGGGRVDYVGAVLLVSTFTPLLLALSLGGISYAWDSPRIIALLSVAAVSFVVFLWFESRTHEPILPLHLFRIKTFRIAVLASFVVSMAFLGVVMFMPLYMQVVQGVNATQSGISLFPLMGGLILSSITCGRLVTRTGRYKPFMIGGGVVLVIGVLLLMQIGPDTTSRDLAWRLAITGIGLGPAQSLFSLVIQNSSPLTQLGVATSISQFSRQIGSTVGVAIFGTFLTHSLTAELPRHIPLLPGATAQKIDLGHAQSQAMNAGKISESVDAALDARYKVIERAYRGDQAAIADILADPRLPEQVKAPLRDGGIRTRVHRQLAQRADAVVAELNNGEPGRERLLNDPALSAATRQQLADIPVRALRDPQVIAGVAALFRNSIVAQEDVKVAAATQQALQLILAGISDYAKQMVGQIERGTKEAFSISITEMMGRALWIVLLGLLVIFFIPEIPLRSRAPAPNPAEPTAEKATE
jgi:EmrB/QacA subfamily drug resistance transporter